MPNFHQLLFLSESKDKKVKQALRNRFGKEIRIEKNKVSEDDKGIDYILHKDWKNESRNIDIKVRIGWDYPGDVALEDWSNAEKKKIGWTRDLTKKTDYICWIWEDAYLILPFKALRDVFINKWEEWKLYYKSARQNTNNLYHSSCIFVPIDTLQEYMECKVKIIDF